MVHSDAGLRLQLSVAGVLTKRHRQLDRWSCSYVYMTDAVADTAAAADDCSRQQSAVYRTTTNPTKLTTFRNRDEKRKLTSTLQP